MLAWGGPITTLSPVSLWLVKFFGEQPEPEADSTRLQSLFLGLDHQSRFTAITHFREIMSAKDAANLALRQSGFEGEVPTAGLRGTRGVGPCVHFAYHFDKSYAQSTIPANPLRVTYAFWKIDRPDGISSGHQAIRIEFLNSTGVKFGEFFIDAGTVGQLQGNLGGADNIFFENDIPGNYELLNRVGLPSRPFNPFGN